MDKLSLNALKVQKILNEKGLKNRVVELPSSTRTSREAADTVSCKVSQIAKAIVFRKKDSNEAVLILASGSNRISEKKVSELCGEKISKADADFVKKETGFSIGGVSPIGHIKKIQIIIDEDLLLHNEIWGAAGTSHGVFKLTPKELLEISEGTIANIKE